jgi:hypothetical protein
MDAARLALAAKNKSAVSANPIARINLTPVAAVPFLMVFIHFPVFNCFANSP